MHRDNVQRTARVYFALPVMYLLACTKAALCQSMGKDTVGVQFDTVEVSGQMPDKQAASRTFSSEDIRTTPGSVGDPMRTLDLSAEVVSNSDLQAIPIIGGDEADGILTLMDGFPITYPYRMLGSLSLFNPLMTNRIELLTAGYPAVYGGYAPTAIRVDSKSEYSDHAKIETDASMFVSSVLAQIPISDSLRWSARIAARASNIGLAAGLLSGSDRERLQTFMPNLKDIQIFSGEMPSANLFAFQECLLSQEHGSLASADRTFDYAWQKEFAGTALITSSGLLSGEHRFSWTHDNISLSTLVPIAYIESGRFGITSQFSTLRLQDQFQYPILPALNLTAGSEILYSISDVGFQTFSTWLNDNSPLQSSFADISVFSEFHWLLTENASATIGVRETYFGFIRQTGFEPRGTFVYDLGDQSNIKLSLGQYLQSPSDFEILHGILMFLAVPDQTPLMMLMSEHRNSLRPETHNLAALDAATPVFQSRSTTVDGTASFYYKETESLIMPARYPDVFTPLDTLSFEPLQAFQGVSWGMGLTSNVNFIPLNLSLTASLFSHHSRIIDTRTKEEYYTIGDKPVVAKLHLQLAPPGWTVGLLYQYSTGAPTTDEYFLKASNLFGDVIYLPLWQKLNSSRVPEYHRLDISVAKDWHSDHWRIEVIASVLNLLGDRNISSYNYTFSADDEGYVKKIPVLNTLPFVPNVELHCGYSI